MYSFKASRYSSHSILLRQLPEVGAGKSVLDVGCGNGYLAAFLADRGYVVTGIERPEGHQSFPPNVSLVEADLDLGLPSLTTKFDFILCADILEHLRDPGRLLQQLRSVLRPGGVLIASLPNSGNIYFRLNILAGRFPQEDKGLFDRTHVRFFMWKGWSELLQQSGWQLHTVESTAIPIGLTVPTQYEHSTPIRTAELLCYTLAKLRKSLFAYQFVITATPV